ncbi:hypothetical protein Tco_1378222 [Tanacetum coccineum]
MNNTSLTNLNYQHYHTIKDDGIVSRLKFVRIGEDYQEYGLPIPETMLTEAIKQSESYQMFIKYSTCQIHPKKSRGKESEPEPKPARKKTSSKRRVKKKVTLSANDNIISDDPDVALELAKSISKTKAEEAEEARKVHATHAMIMTEHVPESARRRKSGKVTSDPSKKVKGVPSLTLEEPEAADIMQALEESKKTSRRQPGIGGSNEGIGSRPRVPDESTIVSATLSEGTGIKPGVPDEEKDITEEKVILEWGYEQESKYSEDDNDDVEKDDKDGDADDEGDDHISDTQDADDEDVETESDEDDIYKYKICDAEVTDAAKADAEKTSEVKDDAKKTELPPSSSSLSVSSGFGDQFLKLSSDSSLVSTVKHTTDSEINSLLEVKIQSEVPHTQSPSVLSVPVSMISEHMVPTPVHESPSTATTTTLPPLFVSTTPFLRVAKLEKDVSDLKKIDLSAEAVAALKTQVLSVVDNYLGSKVGDREQAEKQKMLKFTIKSTDKAALKENPANNRLYHALMEALIEDENTMDKGVADTVKDHKRKHDDNEDPPAGPNQGKKTKRRQTIESESSKKPSSTKDILNGKALTKGSKTGKSASTKELVKEPIAEVVMDDTSDDVARDYNQPQDTSKPKTRKTMNPDWFKQPPRPPTLDPE